MRDYGLDVLIYSVAGGDFMQMDHIERTMTLAEVYHWMGINHYLRWREEKDK